MLSGEDTLRPSSQIKELISRFDHCLSVVEICKGLADENLSVRNMELVCEITGQEIPNQADGFSLGQVHHFLTDDGGESIIEDIIQATNLARQTRV